MKSSISIKLESLPAVQAKDSRIDLYKELNTINEKHGEIKVKLSEIDKEFKYQFVQFFTYKDKADIIDSFENALK